MHSADHDYHHYLHRQAVEIATRYQRTEAELLEILQKIDTKRAFCTLGYASLFDYSTRALKLSEATALNFIKVARKAVEVPALKEAIKAGDLTVSKAKAV